MCEGRGACMHVCVCVCVRGHSACGAPPALILAFAAQTATASRSNFTLRGRR